ncbi:nitrogenase component 1 [Butyrivibrio sp. VCB2006]|uniref:nitrogenase component 1 n=1 Tax=Butyrivibrio sp. VCB2006 TaxID=1280679 RepID=UPI0004063B77|nr:nitrogenase component 1 [Butyrivibrio sp. VCB2006]
MGGIIQEAKYSCALGSQQSVLAIPRAIPIIHAGPGCSARQFSYLSAGAGYQGEGYAGGAQIPSTNSTQNEVVFGGEKKLGKLIDATLDVMDGDLYVVMSGCTAGIVGDDVKQVAEDHSTKEKKVIGVDTAGFRGNNYKGHNLVLESLIEQFVGDVDEEIEPEKGLVNVFSVVPYQDVYWRGDLEEIKRILTGIGLKVNILFGYGSEGVSEWKNIPKAQLNIVLSPWVGLSAAKLCQRKYGTPFLHEPVLPVGLKATSAFLRRVGEALELDTDKVESFIKAEEKRYKKYFVSIGDFLADYSSYIPFDAYVSADDIYGVGISDFLENELGIEVVKVYDSSEPNNASKDRIKEKLESIKEGLGERVVFEGDNALIKEDIKKNIDERKTKSVIFGSSWDRELAYNTKSVLIYLSVPILEKVIVSKSYVGYNGGLQLIEDLYSGVLDKGFIAHTTVEK